MVKLGTLLIIDTASFEGSDKTFFFPSLSFLSASSLLRTQTYPKNRELQLYRFLCDGKKYPWMKYNAGRSCVINSNATTCLRLKLFQRGRAGSWFSSDTLLVNVTFSCPGDWVSPAPWHIWLVFLFSKTRSHWLKLSSVRGGFYKIRLVLLHWRLRLPRQRCLMQWSTKSRIYLLMLSVLFGK